MIPVRIDSGLRIVRDNSTARLCSAVADALRISNPEYHRRMRLNLSLWAAGGPVPTHLLFHETNQIEVRFPRGASMILKREAKALGVQLGWSDQRWMPDNLLAEVNQPGMRGYQQRCVDAMARATQGVVVAPCGSGKTRIGLGIIAHVKVPTLILVHQTELATQWRSQLELVWPFPSGFVGAGKVTVKPITVGMVQTLSKWTDAQLVELFTSFGMIILDEAHHCPASTFAKLIDRCPAMYRFGLTATPEREDGLSALLEYYLGRDVARVTHTELAEAGVLVRPEIKTIDTDFAFRMHGPGDYQPMIAELVSDQQRLELVAREVATAAVEGNTCLVLSTRIAHCLSIADAVRDLGVGAEVMTSNVSRERRQELLDKTRSGELRVLVATQLADEGLDLPELTRVFLAAPAKAKGRTVQRLGRVMRCLPGKPTPMLVDFVDRRVPLLRRQAQHRRLAFASVIGAL